MRSSQIGNAFDALDAMAVAAREGDPAAIGRLNDEQFRRTVFINVATSVRDRVARAEVDFRRGKQRGVSERTLSTTFNEALAQLDAPAALRTSELQVGVVHNILRAIMPHFGETSDPERDCSDPMTPSEAVFLAMFLTTNKLVNPEYQSEPDVWARRVITRNDHKLDPAVQVAIERAQARRRVPLPQRGLVDLIMSDNTHREFSLPTFAAHRFLDRIGLAR